MALEDVNKEVEAKSKGSKFKPAYDSYNFANIPGTIEELIGEESGRRLPEDVLEGIDIEGVKNVALVFVDAFGFTQWERYGQDLDFFNNMIEEGKVTPLRTIFPSETAAAVTTINTGLTPQEHGVYSWRVFLEELDTTVRTLPFTSLQKEELDDDVSALYDGETVFDRLDSAGVHSTSIIPESIAGSDYNSYMMENSDVKGFKNAFDMALKLRKSIENAEGRNYFHCYTDQVDTALHEYGPNTQEHISQLEAVSQALQKQLVDKISGSAAEETLLLIIADHGQADVDPENITDLLSYQTVEKNLETNQEGEIILPTGGPRALFLHVRQGKETEVKSFLEKELEAEVMKTEEAIEENLFGLNKVEKRSRLGDLVVIPDKQEKMIWYDHEKHKGYGDYEGHHGGMSKEEMLIPFAATKLSDLK
jgi:predicted AlkP superfamily pyrophosphatase or phosphodiesterase